MPVYHRIDVEGLKVLGQAPSLPEKVEFAFLKKLMARQNLLEAMFNRLVEELTKHLPDFGRVLAVDGKAIASFARGRKRQAGKVVKRDGRRDVDADWGQKTLRVEREDGSNWEKVVRWFGFKLHLVVDATYELPVAFRVTPASASEIKQGHRLIDQMAEQAPVILKRCEYWLGDRGYDDGKLHTKLWDEHAIKPVIDIRNLWRDGEETRLLTGWGNVVYDYKGQVYCYCPQTARRRPMAYGGFEKDRGSLKYRCPARHYGLTFMGMDRCRVKGAVRIPLKEDPRIFTPLARSSYAWESIYKKRTAVERVNSRLDRVFGFEEHYIRGLKKMTLRCTLALLVMLVMALGRVREKRGQNLRSLVSAA
ncbi:MAG: transposase [Clostridia bacterium]|jgi:hypothetical protein|nr:transposase [Clostridia bacterium]